MRILGLDLGSRRVGIAISDPSGTIASALETVDGRDKDYLVAHIKHIVAEREIAEVVVGRPLHLNGAVGAQAQRYAELTERIANSLDVPVRYQDERFTTVEAHQTMKSMGVDSRKRRDSVDRVAAVIILQTYLDKRKAAERRQEFPAEWG